MQCQKQSNPKVNKVWGSGKAIKDQEPEHLPSFVGYVGKGTSKSVKLQDIRTPFGQEEKKRTSEQAGPVSGADAQRESTYLLRMQKVLDLITDSTKQTKM